MLLAVGVDCVSTDRLAEPWPSEGGDAATRPDGSDRSDGTTDANGSTEASADARTDGPTDAPVSVSRYDVAIVGAGAGGMAAALQAARLGVKVVLLEETDWVGGQMTASAVATMDGGAWAPAGTGIYDEFRRAVATYYANPSRFPPSGKSISTCYDWARDTTCFEPSVGQNILRQMLAGAGVTLRTRVRVTQVLRTANTVTGVVLDDGSEVDSKILVDATEYGDVLPLAGARYRVGNSLSDSVRASSCIQSITFVAVIKKYPNGVPAGFTIALPPPGYNQLLPDFETMFAVNGMPPHWTRYPVNWDAHNVYRGLPDSTNPLSYDNTTPALITKTDINWANDYPGYRIVTPADGGAQSVMWHETLKVEYLEQRERRHQIDCDAKLRTLGFLYYAQTALGQPLWSIANDEGYDAGQDDGCTQIPTELKPLTRNMPPIAYVRESRRIVPVATLTAKQIDRKSGVVATKFRSAIAVGDYGTDLHNCREAADLEADLGETTADFGPGGNFQVPFEALIPESIDGLLAAEKNIGVSRIANGAIRLQPIAMQVGQAVGAVAAQAVQDGVEPRKVSAVKAQWALLSAKSALSLDVFDDIPNSDPSWPDVELATLYGIVGGQTPQHFSPGDPIARGPLAVSLAKLFGFTTSPPATPSFADVPANSPYYAAVEQIYAAGLTSGCGGTPLNYCPDTVTTRAQFAALLVKGIASTGVSTTPPTSLLFSDVPSTFLFFPFIQFAGQNQLLDGCGPQLFCPGDPLTRSQVAQAASRTLRFLAK